MRNALYDAKDYKHFLKSRLSTEDPFPITQTAMAKAAGCKGSYLSQCLNGKVHLLPEQMHAIGVFLRMGEEEIQFLLLMLELERSGSPAHRSFVKKRLTELRETQDRISHHLRQESEAPQSARGGLQSYYNDWYVIAVHMLCTLPEIRSAEEIARRLGLTSGQARHAVKTLQDLGLIQHKDGSLRATSRHLHIGDRDPLISRHHANWRMQASLRSQPAPTTDLHYTAVYSLSRADALQIRDELARTLMRVREKVKPSPEECLAAFGVDWFQLGE